MNNRTRIENKKERKKQSLEFLALRGDFVAGASLLGQQHGLNIGQDASLGDSDAGQQLV